MNRRNFIKLTTSSIVAAGILPLATQGCASTDGPGISLFLVMKDLEKDFAGTLKKVADLGYRKVETIGAMGRDPKHVRQMLDDSGLYSPSQHLAPANLYNVFLGRFSNAVTMDELIAKYMQQFTRQNTEALITEGIERGQALGQKYLCWPIVFPEHIKSEQAVLEICEAFDIAGKMCAKEGMVFLYHNHAIEFESVDGIVPYDTFLEKTDPDFVKFQMDAYWVNKAKADPLDYFRKYPDRYRQCHIKDIDKDGNMTDIGHGEIDFATFIKAARKAGVENFYLEYDTTPHPLKSAKIAYDYLKPIM